MGQNPEERICPNCRSALLYPHVDVELSKDGWVKCVLCGYCKIIESESYKERTKNQK